MLKFEPIEIEIINFQTESIAGTIGPKGGGTSSGYNPFA